MQYTLTPTLSFVVYRFSLSKWIHIHNGDEGLIKFFERVYTVLNPGGFFVLEPQSWESYAKAKRMDPVWTLRRYECAFA